MIINVDLIYPVGSLYLTITSINPTLLFGGTWQQITSDAYLKIVTSGAGSLGGTSSEHKIPVGSMPRHRHAVAFYNTNWTTNPIYGYINAAEWGSFSSTGGANYRKGGSDGTEVGEGNAYYPYYYGIYVWKRIS